MARMHDDASSPSSFFAYKTGKINDDDDVNHYPLTIKR